MPALNGNDAFLSINGYTIADTSTTDPGIFRNVQITRSTDTEDVTAGAGVLHMDKLPKLTSHEFTATIIYEVDSVVSDLPGILGTLGTDDTVTLIYGPEGNASGKPKHEQDFVITSAEPSEQTYDKSLITVQFSGESAGAPTSDMLAGDTWSV